jgi:hypothetical protein
MTKGRWRVSQNQKWLPAETCGHDDWDYAGLNRTAYMPASDSGKK